MYRDFVLRSPRVLVPLKSIFANTVNMEVIGHMNRIRGFYSIVLALAGTVGFGGLQSFGETGTEHPWGIGGTFGWRDLEGDETVDDSGNFSVHVSYDYSERWTFEGVLQVYPSLKGNTRTEWATGKVVNRLLEKTGGPGIGVNETWGVGLSLEGLYHLTRWKRVDPYFVAGVGFMIYRDPLIGSDSHYDYITDEYIQGSGGSRFDPTLNAGLGLMYHFNDSWAVRADARIYGKVGSVQANSLFNVGIEYTLGAGYPHDMAPVGGLVDSDGDGLTDAEEAKYGTDPQDPDTDHDGLNDYDEVKVYGTNPSNPDTDYDMLKDGEEVHHYRTSPLNPDTDKGGVSDGHEVLEDGTDPLNPADDLLLYSLEMEFDTDKADVKPMYFPQLDVIGKVMVRHPASTCVIEGHADKRKSSVAAYNQKLSEKRARAVLAYLNGRWKIGSERMKAKGFGFSRPVAPNDPATGNVKNRRVDIYIDGAKDAAAVPVEDRSAGKVSDTGKTSAKESAPASAASATNVK